MAKDVTIVLEDRPGQLALAGEALGNAGINIEGGCGVTAGGQGTIHLLVEDAAAARQALEGAGVTVGGEHDVLVLDVEDRPGTLGEIGRKLADAGVSIQFLYLATRTRLVIGADQLDAARAAVGG